MKSGALQGAVAIDYPSEQPFDGIHIIYDGTNGQLPNLDVINSIVNIAGGQMGIQTAIQDMKHHDGRYSDRLKTMLRGMLNQGLGNSAGPHSSFIPYHVDSVTLQPYGQGWHDEMAMGRVVEGTFRSLNNLLEHLHQSFFFYLLMQRDRFVSIGTYLPSAMLLSANFTIMAIFLWVKSGQPAAHEPQQSRAGAAGSKGTTHKAVGQGKATRPPSTVERDLALPLGVVAVCQAISIVPLFVFNRLPASVSRLVGLPLTGGTSQFLTIRCAYDPLSKDAFSRIHRFLSSLGSLPTHRLAAHGSLFYANGAALSTHQVLFAAHTGHHPSHARHAQLFARVSHRVVSLAFGVYPTHAQHDRQVLPGGATERRGTPRRRIHGGTALGRARCGRTEESKLWMERMGDAYGRGRLVPVVACLACRDD